MNTAYGDAVEQETVALYATDFNENLLINKIKYIKLKGGFDCSYLGNAGHSNIRGTITISDGTLEIENLVLMPSSAP